MSKRRDHDYLSDIGEGIRRVGAYIAGLSFDELMKDTKTQDAVVRNLEIIGEATKKLSSRLRASHPEIPWKEMAGVRDKMIHDYFGINLDIVWTIAKEQLPGLLPQMEDLWAAEGD